MQTKDEVLQAAVKLAQKELDLTPVKCPPPGEEDSSEVCFGTVMSAEKFRSTLDAVSEQQLKSITGWRDDFGVLSAIFELSGQRSYEIGFIYKRPGFAWKVYKEAYKPLQGKALVRVGVSERSVPDR